MNCLNDIECYVSGYSVVAQAGTVAGTVDFVLQDSCGTLRDGCRMGAVLVKAAKGWLTQVASEETVYDADACKGYWSECQTAGSNVAIFSQAKTLTLTTAETAPVAPITATIMLGSEFCSQTVTFA